MLIELTLTQEEYNRRVSENTEAFISQFTNNRFEVSSYHLSTNVKGELSVPVLIKNQHDIFAAAILGVLAIPNLTGADAIRMVNGVPTFLELKTSYIHRSNVWKNENGTLYVGNYNNKNQRQCAESSLSASYHIVNNLEGKDIHTVFIALDATTNELIGAYEMSGSKVVEYLTTNKNTGVAKITRNRSIKMSTFRKYGSGTATVVPYIGWDKWKEDVGKTAPLVKFKQCSKLR